MYNRNRIYSDSVSREIEQMVFKTKEADKKMEPKVKKPSLYDRLIDTITSFLN